MTTNKQTEIKVGDTVRFDYEPELETGTVVKIVGESAWVRVPGFALSEKRYLCHLIKVSK